MADLRHSPRNPRVVQATSSRFHQFDLARQLEQRGLLDAIYSGYPRWKLRREGLPQARIHAFPWWHVPWMAGVGGLASRMGWGDDAHLLGLRLLDAHVARSLEGRTVDVLIAMSGHGLRCGAQVQRAGGAWICVRGSTHVRYQDRILRAEHARWGVPGGGRSARAIAREEAEYAHADRIAVPSGQVWRSFVAEGMSEQRLALVPYGVDLARFYPVGKPPQEEFRVVFVGALSVRKGLGHLLQAFARLRHPRKKLLLAGPAVPETRALLRQASEDVTWLGPLPQARLRELFSESHVMVLPSVEEGLANVMGQALACGCPVIATVATGAEDLFTDGREGFIVPYAAPALLTNCLERIAGERHLRRQMSEAGLKRVRELGGWDNYGDKMEALIRSLCVRSP